MTTRSQPPCPKCGADASASDPVPRYEDGMCAAADICAARAAEREAAREATLGPKQAHMDLNKQTPKDKNAAADERRPPVPQWWWR